ncbi:Ankyrin-2 [Madurella mycetomatis]|uniref:Ankyrin-2 n=1 Tax=Madurella mycetomatis TaxID=100816 RepID=A0A175WDN8_9PEZI|nr:Ankyrin-2 [Madurella mycetomatis]
MNYNSDVNIDVVSSDEDVSLIGMDDVSNYNPDHILPETPAVINKIRQWLDPTPYRHDGGEYHRHLASHAEGTGRWLTATENYRKWHAGSDHGLLWIKGIPGSGKSVFAATLADALAREGHPVLFFFFRQIIDANHKPMQLLRDWLDQVLEYSPPLQRNLKAYVDEDRPDLNRDLESVGIDDLWKHLKTALAHISRVYLVADALDEMDKDNDKFLSALASLGMWKPAEVKVLITSRPVSTVEAPLREFPALRIRLEERFVDVDIATYVQRGLESSTISAQDRALIKEAVPGRANGLFLYAKLAMDAFLEPGADVQHVLRTLPADLNAMYTDLLREHARRSGVPSDVQRLLLCWVTHATRPLRLIEMAEMISVTHNVARCHGDLKSAKALVRAACGPLLEIHPNETVSVVHHSLTEFLLGSTRPAGDTTSFPVLMPGPTHEQLGLSCIQYLLSSGCLDGSGPVRETETDSWMRAPRRGSHARIRLEFPFAEYASRNWSLHVAKAASDDLASATLLSAMDSFFTPGSRLSAWLDTEWKPLATKGVMPCHIAARYGLTLYLGRLIRRDGAAVVNCVDFMGQTPLFHAASAGHDAAVKMLLDAGANPDPHNKVGLKPLHRVASNNHASVVTLLLAAGVDPLTEKTDENPGRWCGNAPRTMGHTPLMYACQAGHVAVVEAFLPYLKGVNTVQRALDWASRAARTDVVKLLVQQPDVDVNAKVRGNTALFNACKNLDIGSMEALIAAGADATISCLDSADEFAGAGSSVNTGTLGVSPLEAFCKASGSSRDHYRGGAIPRLGHDNLQYGIELLLRAGADINRYNSHLETPLHHAAGNLALMRLLLAWGADPTAESSDGSTLLHSRFRGQEGIDIVRLLVEDGKADINKRRRSDGKTPLSLFVSAIAHDSSQGSDFVVRFIDEFRPDPTIADNNGDTPLHLAVSLHNGEQRVKVTDALLVSGARIDQRNRKGEMAIHVAKDMSTIELLVSRGADLEGQDGSGATPLMRRLASLGWQGKLRDVCRLLELGARLDTRDFSGRTLLHEAAGQTLGAYRKVADDPVQHLLSLGLDPRLVDYAGNTILHEFVQHPAQFSIRGRISAFEDLVRRGADPNAVNYAGQTLLHVLLSKQGLYDETIAAACEKSIIDAADKEGVRPIHIAANTSQRAVFQVMAAGADILAPTYEGLTPLHIAARGRQSNIVGMLLAAIKGAADDSDAAAAAIDAVDGRGRTPLYYACLSGRPESVALLLEAGAKVTPYTEKLLEACLAFEEEERVLSPKGKPTIPRSLADLKQPAYIHFSTRLDEILSMLVDHGLDLSGKASYGLTHLQRAMYHLDDSDLDHTVRCFFKMRAELVGGAHSGDPLLYPTGALSQRSTPFAHRWAEIRREAAAQVFEEMNLVSQVKGDPRRQERLLLELLARREFGLVEAAYKPGGCDPCLVTNEGWTLLHALVALGHASLLAKVATQDGVKQIDNVEWRKKQEQPENGEISHGNRGSILPLVLATCQREVPNMDVLRFLVEHMNASVDAAHLAYMYQSETGGYGYETGDSPLHVLARGENWWQVSEALPYLLSRKPDLEARSYNGETPLHRALDTLISGIGPFNKQAARLLVAAGADVNAVTKDGQTPLILARTDVELIQFLIVNGAKVTPKAVFAAIDNEQVQVLDAFLSSSGGVDPSTLRIKPSKTLKPKNSSVVDLYLRQSEKHALHQAALPLYRRFQSVEENEMYEMKANMMRTLMAHGASPWDKFRIFKPGILEQDQKTADPNHEDGEPPESEVQHVTVAHHVLRCNGIIEPFLELPGLDLEHRNHEGETLLLAACSNPGIFCRIVDLTAIAPAQIATATGTSQTQAAPYLIDYLLQRGADPTARDDNGRNALHRALSRIPHPRLGSASDLHAHFLSPFLSLLSKAPSLVNQADDKGQTPLHVALQAMVIGLMDSTADDSDDNNNKSTAPGLAGTIINRLLAAGADPRAVDSDGNTALHFAVRSLNVNRASPGVFRKLVALGLDVNARNARGETPLLFGALEGTGRQDEAASRLMGPMVQGPAAWAAPGRGNNIWQVLEEAGADFKAQDCEGRTLLHLAAESGRWWKEYKMLVGKGLNPLALDGRERTSLDVAAAYGNEEVLAMFEKEEANGKKIGEEGEEDDEVDDEN